MYIGRMITFPEVETLHDESDVEIAEAIVDGGLILGNSIDDVVTQFTDDLEAMSGIECKYIFSHETGKIFMTNWVMEPGEQEIGRFTIKEVKSRLE